MDELAKEQGAMEFCYMFSWNGVIGFINSQFFSSMWGALLGAFAGAFAAHSMSVNARQREELEGQIRAVNSAITAAFLICNTLLSVKKQQITTMHKTFLDEKTRFEACLKDPTHADTRIFGLDMEYLHMPQVPAELLYRQAYEKLDLRGRQLGLVSALSNSLSLLQRYFELRNSLLDRFRETLLPLPEEIKLAHYFGIPTPDGHIHKEYADALEGINQEANNAIFFSSQLCSDLVMHGNVLRDNYVKKYRKEIEKISAPNFDTPEAKGLIPDSKEYESWLTMFVSLPLPQNPHQPWYMRFWR